MAPLIQPRNLATGRLFIAAARRFVSVPVCTYSTVSENGERRKLKPGERYSSSHGTRVGWRLVQEHTRDIIGGQETMLVARVIYTDDDVWSYADPDIDPITDMIRRANNNKKE